MSRAIVQTDLALCATAVAVLTVGCVEETPRPQNCAPGQYVVTEEAGERVCAACTAGHYSAEMNAPSCSPCPAGQYSAAPNARSCIPWTECMPGGHVASEGDAVTDRTCAACAFGTYSAESNAMTCTPWTECARGEYVVSEGDATADRACATCPTGTYSETMNTPSCTPWTECAPWEEVEATPGTSTSDRACTVVGWTRQFGTSAVDIPYAVAVDGSDGVVVAGSTAGTLPGQTWAGGRDAFVRRYDAAGNELWTRQFGTYNQEVARGVAVDASGNVVVVGHTSGVFPGQTSLGGDDAFVRMYDASGTELWTRQFGERFTDQARGVAVDASGNVLVVGHTLGPLPLPGQTHAGGRDAFVRMYDAAGTELWTDQFGTIDDDFAEAVSVDASGNVAVVGNTSRSLPGQTSVGLDDAFVRLYDAAGTELWTDQFGTTEHDVAFAVAMRGGGEVVVAGYTGGTLPGQTSAGRDDAFVRSYDAAGTELWTRQFGSTNNDVVRGMSVDGTGSVVVTGQTLSALPGQMWTGGYDVFVQSVDAFGSELWTHQFGTMPHENDYGRAVSVDGSGNVVVAGYTDGALPGQTNAGRDDAFVVKLVP